MEHVDSNNDNTNDNIEESSISQEKVQCILEPVKKDFESADDSNKETSNFYLEPLTNDSDSIDENNKESINNFSEDNMRSVDLSDRVVEALDEECNIEGEIGAFYNAVSYAEESSAEDDAFHE